jgi:hypothetical protein
MGQQIEHEEHDKFVISCVPLKTQARSMYALVNSESANVAVTPVVPSGKVKRPAEAIVIIASAAQSERDENTHKSRQNYHLSLSRHQLLSMVNLNRETMSEHVQHNLY